MLSLFRLWQIPKRFTVSELNAGRRARIKHFAHQQSCGEVAEKIGNRHVLLAAGPSGDTFAGQYVVITGCSEIRQFCCRIAPRDGIANCGVTVSQQFGAESRHRNDDRSAFVPSRKCDDVAGTLSRHSKRNVISTLK